MLPMIKGLMSQYDKSWEISLKYMSQFFLEISNTWSCRDFVFIYVSQLNIYLQIYEQSWSFSIQNYEEAQSKNRKKP